MIGVRACNSQHLVEQELLAFRELRALFTGSGSGSGSGSSSPVSAAHLIWPSEVGAPYSLRNDGSSGSSSSSSSSSTSSTSSTGSGSSGSGSSGGGSSSSKPKRASMFGSGLGMSSLTGSKLTTSSTSTSTSRLGTKSRYHWGYSKNYSTHNSTHYIPYTRVSKLRWTIPGVASSAMAWVLLLLARRSQTRSRWVVQGQGTLQPLRRRGRRRESRI